MESNESKVNSKDLMENPSGLLIKYIMRFKSTYILTAILALATVYFYQYPGFNGDSRLDAVRAVVEQGKLTIDAYQAQPDWTTADRALYKGHYYTDKAAGSSLFAIPLYYLLYKTAVALSISLTSSFIKHFLTTLVIGTSFVVNGLVMYQIALLISQSSAEIVPRGTGRVFGNHALAL